MGTFAEYLNTCAITQPAEQRAGQYAFNLLVRVRPDLAEQVRNTSLDPFHQNSILTKFFNFVYENWDVKPAKPKEPCPPGRHTHNGIGDCGTDPSTW